MKSRILVLFLLLTSIGMFAPAATMARSKKASVSAASSHARSLVQRRHRRRRRIRLIRRRRGRIVYHYGYRNGVWYRSRIN
jgi:hypothetical protein